MCHWPQTILTHRSANERCLHELISPWHANIWSRKILVEIEWKSQLKLRLKFINQSADRIHQSKQNAAQANHSNHSPLSISPLTQNDSHRNRCAMALLGKLTVFIFGSLTWATWNSSRVVADSKMDHSGICMIHYLYVCVSAYANMYIYIYIYVCNSIVYMYIVYMYIVYIYICIYTHIYIHRYMCNNGISVFNHSECASTVSVVAIWVCIPLSKWAVTMS